MNFLQTDPNGLAALLDLIIPPNQEAGIPGGSQVGFEPDKNAWESLKILDDSAQATFNKTFLQLNYEDRLNILSKERKRHKIAFIQLARLLVEHYYQHRAVCQALGLPMSPPFPEGCHVEDGDLSLLESVYRRGPIYRNVD